MNNRGQFFLITAIIVIGIIIGFASAVNSINVGDKNEVFYDLADEVNFETKKVLDYGVYNGKNEEEKNELVRSFISKYSDYFSQEQLVFIYGDKDGLDAFYFVKDPAGSVGINTGTPINSAIPITDVKGRTAIVEKDSEDIVSVNINDIPYQFELKQGENFFFVLVKDVDGEKFVAQR